MPNWLILALTVRAARAAGSSAGYCGVTKVTGKQGCNRHGQRGAWLLSAAEATDWATARRVCVERCMGCARCTVISFSLAARDCS